MTDFRTPNAAHSSLLRLGFMPLPTLLEETCERSAAQPQAFDQRLVAIGTSPP